MLSTGLQHLILPGHVIPQKAYNGVKGIWYVDICWHVFTACSIQYSPVLMGIPLTKETIPMDPWTRGPFGQIATPGRLLEHLERCALVGTCWEWGWSFLFLGKPMVEFKRHLFWEAPIKGWVFSEISICSTQAFNACFRLFPPPQSPTLNGAVKNSGHNRTYLFPTLFDKLQTFDRASGRVGFPPTITMDQYQFIPYFDFFWAWHILL